jgi:hypothetical protein
MYPNGHWTFQLESRVPVWLKHGLTAEPDTAAADVGDFVPLPLMVE